MKRLLFSAAACAATLSMLACLDFGGARDSYCEHQPDICGLTGAGGDGGQPDGGGTDGGTDGGTGVPGCPGVFDPDTIYLGGTLMEGAGNVATFGPLTDPTHPCVGFTQNLSRGFVRPTDGRLLYFINGHVRAFAPETYTVNPTTNAVNYPPNTQANDPIVSTSYCNNTNGTTDLYDFFFVRPDNGDLIYKCYLLGNGTYYDSRGAVTPPNTTIVAAGYGGELLIRGSSNSYIQHPDGGQVPLNVNVPASFVAVRALPDKFMALYFQSNPGFLYYYEILLTGEVTSRFIEGPQNTLARAALDREGNIYFESTDSTGANDIVIKQTPDGGRTVIYDETPGHASPAPPVFNFIHASPLLTGP